jgi:hypothetical protein
MRTACSMRRPESSNPCVWLEKAAIASRLAIVEVQARRYALSADELNIELWYNDDLGWVGLASDTGKGGRLVYRRM